MRLKALLADDENAVSPVIGVILMVAITVILAAVIASFVLGLGPGGAAPTVNFDSEFTPGSEFDDSVPDNSPDGNLTVSVRGGDSVPADQISLSGSSVASVQSASDNSTDTIGWPADQASGSVDGESAISAGDDVNVFVTTPYEVNIVWESDDGGTTQTLTTYEGE